MEALSTRPQLTIYQDGKSHTIDFSNVIFILVSDIGADRMHKILLAHETREQVPHAEIVSAVKDALDLQWKRLQFGKMVHEVVPFLPLEPHHIAEIIALKLEQMGQAHNGTYWRSLRIQRGVCEYLAQSNFVKYTKHQAQVDGTLRTRIYAKYGARNVVNSGPIQRLKSLMFQTLRPWNIYADIVLMMHQGDLEIHSCASETGSESIELGCQVRWKGQLNH